MNEQFRIAHKLGLMFFHDTPLPEDVKAWAILNFTLNLLHSVLRDGSSMLKVKSGQSQFSPTFLNETICLAYINTIEKGKRWA